MARAFLSGQLGTDQLGLAQLGQFKKTGAPAALSIDGSNTSVVEATATPFVAGGVVSGPVPPGLNINGNVVAVKSVHAIALSAGAVLNTPGLAAAPGGKGSWRWWEAGELAFELIQQGLEAPDDVGKA